MLLCPGRGARLGLVGLGLRELPLCPYGLGVVELCGKGREAHGRGRACGWQCSDPWNTPSFISGCSGMWKEGSAMVPCPQIPESLSLCLAGWRPTIRAAVEATCPFSRLAGPA